MIPNTLVFRQYDIRGKADTDFPDAFCRDLGRAIASAASTYGGKQLVVGRDCRLSSPRIAEALIAGMLQSGANIIDVGVVPTPVVYFASAHFDAAGAVVVTGSHNPKEDNGFKLMLGNRAAHGAQIEDLHRRMRENDYVDGEGSLQSEDVSEAYLAAIKAGLDFGPARVKLVTDAGNGAGGPLLARACEMMNIEATHLNNHMDGTFPVHHPDPTVPEYLQQLVEAVRAENATLGIALDGDADRVGVVSAAGEIIYGDMLTLLLAQDVLREHPGAPIIGEVKCSQALFDGVRESGGKPIMWRVGHSLIKEKMREENAPLAGEMSGHLFFKDRYGGFDDGIYAALRIVELASKPGFKEALAGLPSLANTPEIRLPCPDDKKFSIVQAVSDALASRDDVKDVVTIDGCRANFGDGWGLVRASNTQAALIVRCEADNQQALQRIKQTIEQAVDAASQP